MNKRKLTKIVHEGKYMAEVDVEIIDVEAGWAPYISLEDALRLDDVRGALRAGDLEAASKIARVYEIVPVNKAA